MIVIISNNCPILAILEDLPYLQKASSFLDLHLGAQLAVSPCLILIILLDSMIPELEHGAPLLFIDLLIGLEDLFFTVLIYFFYNLPTIILIAILYWKHKLFLYR